MPDIEEWLSTTYDSLPNYNYGWWLTTREHLDVATLVTAAQFIYGRFGRQAGSLSSENYNDFQRALGRTVPQKGAKTALDRHLLLNMWRPLRLIDRVQNNRINPFYLTDYGLNLAQTAEPRRILESILREIKFVDEDWTRPKVMDDYAGISVRPHQVLHKVLVGLDEYLTRDEYRLFISRMRSDEKESIDQVIELIINFRACPESFRNSLLLLEFPLFPKQKAFHNWIDMALHTFSLFSLGTQFRRNDKILVLAGTAVDATIENAFVLPEGSTSVQTAVPNNLKRASRRKVELKTPSFDPELDTPPAPNIEANSGQEAEGYIKRLLEANGFEVRDFSHYRGYGFDLWTRHSSTGNVYYCEVKSSIILLATIEFTRLEVEAAQKYRERYLVFCVENFDCSKSSGDVWTLQDPWNDLPSVKTPKTTTTYSAPRSEWRLISTRLD